MDKRFLRAFLTPSSTTIEGYTMFPWCIKHRIWLSAIESPFMSDDGQITVPSLIIALKACSEQPFGKPTWHDKWTGFQLTRNPKRFEAACRAFIAHTDNSETWPKFYEKKNESGSGSASTIPWQLGIIANLVRNGVNYADAMQMPESKAIWLSTVFSIHAGAKLDILSTDDEELIDSMPKVDPQTVTKNT